MMADLAKEQAVSGTGDLDLRNLRIGWVVDGDPNEAAIRRRFRWFADQSGFEPEEAHVGEKYDVVWISQLADYTRWADHPRSCGKVIVDLLDAYLAVPDGGLGDRLRGFGRFVCRDFQRPCFSYNAALKKLLARADLAIVGSSAQADLVRPFCENVRVILDSHDEAVLESKSEYGLTDEHLNIVWDGGFGTLRGFSTIHGALARFAAGRKVAIHLITWMIRATRLKTFRVRHARDVVDEIFDLPGVSIHIHEWDAGTLSKLIVACDIGVLPVAMDPFSTYKSANRLIFNWRHALPTIAADTASHRESTPDEFSQLLCATEDDWVRELNRLADSESDRREAGTALKRHAEENYSSEILLGQWKTALKDLLA